jgi:hypothetical protein
VTTKNYVYAALKRVLTAPLFQRLAQLQARVRDTRSGRWSISSETSDGLNPMNEKFDSKQNNSSPDGSFTGSLRHRSLRWCAGRRLRAFSSMTIATICRWMLFSATACKLGFEGIVSKRLGSPYRSGRSRDWLKMKTRTHPQ